MAIDTMLYPPTAEEIADFEAFVALSELSSVMEANRTTRLISHEAVEMFGDWEKITDAQSFAAVLRPSGVRPRPMRFANLAGTRRGYSAEVVWDGMERIFRRHVGEPSGVPRPQVTPGKSDNAATFALYFEFVTRCPVADAWLSFWTAEGVPDYTEPFPATPEDYRSRRFGELFVDEDQRRGPSNEQEERRVQLEIRALSRPRRLV
jgi:hypothetical protein